LLVIILVFMGLTNAFGMVPPVYELQLALGDMLNTNSDLLTLIIIFGVGNLLLPVGVTLLAAWLSRALAGRKWQQHSLRHITAAFAPAFVPLGLGIWI